MMCRIIIFLKRPLLKNNIGDRFMSIKNTRLLHRNSYISKQFKKTNLLEKIKTKYSIRTGQTALKNDVVSISSRDKKILAKANFSFDESSLAFEDSIFGKQKPNMPFIKMIAGYFSSIFGKKVSPEKAVEKMNAYQQLSYIKDSKEFCQKAFEQIKNDFGYKDLNIPLIFDKPKIFDASWDLTKGVITLCLNLSKKFNGQEKTDIIEYLMHEFRHTRQTEMAYRTSVDGLLDAISENYPRRIVGDLLGQSEEAQIKMAESTGKSLEDFQKMLRELGLREKIDYKMVLNGKEQIFDKDNAKIHLEQIFGKLKPFRKGSLKYRQGLNFIEGERTYVPGSIDMEKYKNGILEKDAYTTKSNWHNIINLTD